MDLGSTSAQNLLSEMSHLINVKDFAQAEILLSRNTLLLQNAATYLLQSRIAQHRGEFHNAWLWLWRGLAVAAEDLQLQREMAVVLELMKRPWDPSAVLEPNIRVLQGTMEIGNQMNVLSAGLKELGTMSQVLSYYQFYLGYASDFSWNLAQEKDPNINKKLQRLTRDLVNLYDVFHFHFGTSLTLDHSDLAMLVESGKSILMQHWGSEVRLLSKARQSNPYAKVKVANEASIRQRLSTLSATISDCMVADMELYQYVKDYYENVHIVPSMVDLDAYHPLADAKTPAQRPLLVHAPTNQDIKGTQFILRAVEKLKQRYSFDFQLIQCMSHAEAKSVYQQADIVIDQLHIGSYGLLAVESMAMGKPVICWISDFMHDNYPKDLPIVSANPDNITQVLEHLLQNLDALPDIGQKSRVYVERVHDMRTNSGDILNIYRAMGSKGKDG